ncbi:hypothetical protein [Adhaeribacter rhizoryzae]|uniref:XRE family transcriptional regulator n=1 Tax=Adhaeribacter rhizoryzae TaxID=2607907 RepID=A0A5M6CXJ5_9BACT|nr:hypothetical protein [Adhaeribacter rhizoryzae]KAA5539130.1 hypothetical protein F0145_25005 [Adhaeribacter rhizoryzae]
MSSDAIANKKFEKAKLLFDQGLIKEFKELFDVAPYSVVAKKINTNNIRFKEKLENPMTLKLGELNAIANLLKIDSVALYALVLQESSAKKEQV